MENIGRPGHQKTSILVKHVWKNMENQYWKHGNDEMDFHGGLDVAMCFVLHSAA